MGKIWGILDSLKNWVASRGLGGAKTAEGGIGGDRGGSM